MGIKAGFSIDHEVWKQYRISTMETSYFYPTEEEITERARNTKVKQVLESGVFGSSVYMVAGIKIARGFVATSKNDGGHSVSTKVDADLSLVNGVPVGVGAKIHSKSSESEHIALKVEQDIVFAYQLREIVQKGRKENVVIKPKEYLPKAAFLNHGQEAAEEADETVFELMPNDVAQSELLELYDADDVEFDIAEVAEDGESCFCIAR